jgi:hypothetical protein
MFSSEEVGLLAAAQILGRPLAGKVGTQAALELARARLAADLPRGADRIHPSWIPVEPGFAAPPPAGTWLRRALCGQLVDMPLADPPAVLTDAWELPRFPGDVVRRAVETAGRRRLATAVQAAPPGAAAMLAAQLGAHARQFLDEAARPAGREEIRRAVRELSDVARGGGDVVFAAGARTLAPLLTAGDLARQTAQRIDRPSGERLLAEVRAARPVSDEDERLALLTLAVAG